MDLKNRRSSHTEMSTVRPSRPRHTERGATQNSVIAIFKRLAMELVTIPDIKGRGQKMTRAEAILLKNYTAALQGDKSAGNNIWRLLERSGELVDQNDPAIAGKPIVVPEKIWNTDELLEEYGVSIVQSKSTRTI
ncbi:hypothetical protein [Bradyrhizobium japonicum]|uniref:hypothetical protein n=1 Tax=Bradyrhizobium japonicum TaxID=375 RepID=UPI0012BB59C7|nr:hypothetical protein [Bradyrhizobium japonicum]